MDVASYEGALGGVTASLLGAALNTGDAEVDVYVGMEGLRGSSHADGLTGDDGRNLFEGLAGDDRLHGGAGADGARFAGDRTDYVVSSTETKGPGSPPMSRARSATGSTPS